MTTYSTPGTDDAAGVPLEHKAASGERVHARPVEHPVDTNAVRWVLAATVGFWLVVYAAGSSFF